ncbi:MAG: HAMP domain-containing sensor histidine kinase [Nitrososphaera sp.]
MEKEFINIAAHELRTPLTPIITTMYLAKPQDDDGISDITLTREGYETVVRNAKRLEKLSNNILDVVRIDGGKLTLQREIFDITKMIEKVIEETMNTVPSSETTPIHCTQTLEGIGSSAPILVNADDLKIFEVLSNLLRNAMRFAEGGIITVSAQKQGDSVVVQIKDDGKGIDPDVMPKLFQKFASSSDTGGTGLGLFISKSIVEAHGGKIWGENNLDGRGATFAFALPVGEA